MNTHPINKIIERCVILLLCLACNNSGQNHSQSKSASQSTSSPLTVSLKLNKAPKLSEPTAIECTIRSSILLPHTKAKIQLPEAAVFVSGDTSWQGTINPDSTIRLAAILKFVKEGNWVIRAFTRHDIDADSWWGDAKEVHLYVGKNFGKFGAFDTTKAAADAEKIHP